MDKLDNFQSRTLALAGVFQSAALVNVLANEGTITTPQLAKCVASIFITDPEDVLEVYGEIKDLHLGFETLVNQFSKNAALRDMDIARYVVSILFLERRLSKQPELLTTLAKGIDVAASQAEHFTATHENVIANLADLYTRTISELGPRIMVNGEQEHLQSTQTANKIRTVLLAGIRSAVLWQQLGGRRWHIIFSRKQYLQTARDFIEYTERN